MLLIFLYRCISFSSSMVSRVSSAWVSPLCWIIIINIILLNTILVYRHQENYKYAVILKIVRIVTYEDVYRLIHMWNLLILCKIDVIRRISLALDFFTSLFCSLFCLLLHGHCFGFTVFSYCFCSYDLPILIFRLNLLFCALASIH